MLQKCFPTYREIFDIKYTYDYIDCDNDHSDS